MKEYVTVIMSRTEAIDFCRNCEVLGWTNSLGLMGRLYRQIMRDLSTGSSNIDTPEDFPGSDYEEVKRVH
jgi:hypothetical protein